jgi:hypothetical protein
MSERLPYNDKEASDLMFRSLDCRGGGKFIECQCGIDHYATGPDNYDVDYDPDEVPDESDKVKLHDYSTVTYGELNGQVFVDDCQGCKERLRRFENFIWNEKNTIRYYLKNRIDAEKKWADEQQLLNIMAGIK